MSKDQIVGTWRLLSTEYLGEDGSSHRPFGEQEMGVLSLDAAGNMAIQSGDPSRPAFASPDRAKATPEEIKAAFFGYSAYFGTYTVDEDKQAILIQITLGMNPSLRGMAQTRFFEVESDRLVLRIPPFPLGGKNMTGLVTWERIG